VADSTGTGDAFIAGLRQRLCAVPRLLVATEGSSADSQAVVAPLRFAPDCGALG
jgi:hypothetical protein